MIHMRRITSTLLLEHSEIGDLSADYRTISLQVRASAIVNPILMHGWIVPERLSRKEAYDEDKKKDRCKRSSTNY